MFKCVNEIVRMTKQTPPIDEADQHKESYEKEKCCEVPS